LLQALLHGRVAEWLFVPPCRRVRIRAAAIHYEGGGLQMGGHAPDTHLPAVMLRHVQEVEEQPKAMGPAALLKKVGKKERHRSGYDAATTLMHRATAAAAFVFGADPMAVLASATRLVLDGPDSVPPPQHASTAVRSPRRTP
jgi:hypothetical protein